MDHPLLYLTTTVCREGNVLPLTPAALQGIPAHIADSSRLPELRVGCVLRDVTGQPRFKSIGQAWLPRAKGGAAACCLLTALRDCAAGPLRVTVERSGWALARITLSDKGAAGLRKDESGPALGEAARSALTLCHEQGFLLPDDPTALRALVTELALSQGYDLILTTGGTGLSPRDTTPEALLPLLERRLHGFEQAMLQVGLDKTPHAAISRSVVGTLDRTLILALPGSRRAALENLTAVLPALVHALEKLHGDTRDCGR